MNKCLGIRVPLLTVALVLSVSSASRAQTGAVTLSQSEHAYFRQLFLSLAVSASSTTTNYAEQRLIKDFQFSSGDTSLFRGAVQQFSSTLAQLRAQEMSTPATNTTALAALAARLDQAVDTAAIYVLGAVQPDTASRLRVPARIVGQAIAKSGGRW